MILALDSSMILGYVDKMRDETIKIGAIFSKIGCFHAKNATKFLDHIYSHLLL